MPQHVTFLYKCVSINLKRISSCPEFTDLEGRDRGSGHTGSREDLVKLDLPHLDPGRNVIDNADGFGVWVAR